MIAVWILAATSITALLATVLAWFLERREVQR